MDKLMEQIIEKLKNFTTPELCDGAGLYHSMDGFPSAQTGAITSGDLSDLSGRTADDKKWHFRRGYELMNLKV